MRIHKVEYSIVIPVFNEEESLKELHSRLLPVMNSIGDSFEIIFVSDGSSDNSVNILKEMHSQDNRIKLIELSRNFGHQVAITAGLQFSKGNSIIIMDGDLQDPPEVVPNLIKKMDEGYDVVFAVRKKRKENLFKRFSYFAFYRFLKIMADIDIPLDSGDFCIMKRKVADIINSMPERNRFIRGLRSWVGFYQTEMEYDRDARFAGEIKYTFFKLLKLALDGIISFSYVPLRVVAIFGFFVSCLGFLGILFVLYLRLLTDTTVPGTTTIIILVLFIGGVQLIATGIGGEYIGRIYDEVKNRPQYVVKQLIGFE